MNTDEKIRELKAELSLLEQKLESYKEPWQNKLVNPNTEDYYIIHSDKGVPTVVKVPFNPDKPSLRKPEHAFRTEEQAELLKEKLCLLQEMNAFAHVLNAGWQPNFESLSHGILIAGGKPTASTYTGNRNYFVFGIAVASPEIAELMVKEFGDRIEAYYEKQY